MNTLFLQSLKNSFLIMGVFTGLTILSSHLSFASENNSSINIFEKPDVTFENQETLSVFEIGALERMGEEEFLARDVYIALYDIWGTQIFSNISQSEQTHADLVIDLTNKYSLSNFANHKAGVFESEELQTLYNDLIEQGSVSELEAFKVGALIEDLDIYDLEEFLLEVENEEVVSVFENLNRGSRNHMRAFMSQIEKKGGSYSPSFISEERFEEIISTEKEKGNGSDDHESHDYEVNESAGKGNGNGGNGQGKGSNNGNGNRNGQGGNGENNENSSGNENSQNNESVQTDSSKEEQGFFAWLWSLIF